MNNSLKCQYLFSFNSDFFKNLFRDFSYPWEIIPHIREITDRLTREGLDGYTAIGDGILIGKGVRISKSAHIEGPCFIGDGTEIRHGAFLRGSVIIGAGCVIGNSGEIKNAILMDRVQVPHFNYVGDSILGEGAHLGAGAICSNLRSDGKSVRIGNGDDRIETGMRKLGAILGDGVEVGCGTVLCPGTVIGKNTSVYPLVSARGIYPENSVVKATDEVVTKKP